MATVRLALPGTQDPAANAPEIRLYGWDSRGAVWHGPNELSPRLAPDKRLLQTLQSAPAHSWYGPVSCCAAAEPATRFFILIHDLADCAVVSIYDNESKAGPAEILAFVPASRRARLREDFAFEFLAFAGFLNAIPAGAELEAHDGIAAALAGAGASDCVFSISSGLLTEDLDLALSRCAEKLAATLSCWLSGRDSA